MSEIDRGILNGVNISEETASKIKEVAEVEEKLDNISDVKETLSQLMGAESKPNDIGSTKAGNAADPKDGGVLKGVSIDNETAAELKDVADTLKSKGTDDALEVAMGLKADK